MVKISCAVDEIKSLTSNEMRAIMDQDKTGEHLILDVRQPQEYQAGHIPGAMLIPLGELEARQGELDRSKTIITYCYAGHRSMAAAIVLCGLGFEGVQHLEGGIEISSALARVDEKFTNEMEALEIAVEKEYMSYDFYKRISALVEDPESKALLHELALEERRHAGNLLEQLAEVVR